MGVATHLRTDERLGGVLVVLQGAALTVELETVTNAYGMYRFEQLPAGTYIIRVFAGTGEASESTTLLDGARVHADFSLDPEADGFACRHPEHPGLDPSESLMSISEGLAALNHARFQAYDEPFTPENSRQAARMRHSART